MIRLLHILLCITTVYSCKPQTISEDEVYEAVENIIEEMEKDESIKSGILNYPYLLDKSFDDLSDLYSDVLNKNFDKHFSIDDKKAFENQLEYYKDFSFRQEKIKSKKILHRQELKEINSSSIDSYWESYISRYGEVGFYDISFPFFSVDRKKMLVKVYRDFPNFGGGNVYLFVKENGKWKKKKVLGFIS